MTIKELRIELDKLGVPRTLYSINGSLSPDAYMLNKVYPFWECFYFDERGNTSEYRRFASENDACKYLYQKLKDVMLYCYPPK